MSGKKSKFPVQLDIGNMLAALEKKQHSQKDKQDVKPVVLSGALAMLRRLRSFLSCLLRHSNSVNVIKVAETEK